MIPEAGRGCEHGVPLTWAVPALSLWPGGAGGRLWALPPPAPAGGPRDPAQGSGTSPHCPGDSFPPRGLTAAVPGRLRQRPNRPAGTRGALLRAPAACSPHSLLSVLLHRDVSGKEKMPSSESAPGPARPRLRAPNRSPSDRPGPGPAPAATANQRPPPHPGPAPPAARARPWRR